MAKQKAIINDEFPNGKLVDMTPEEETQLATDQANAVAETDAFLTSIENKEANKASAKAKLMAGEALTEAEADAIVL